MLAAGAVGLKLKHGAVNQIIGRLGCIGLVRPIANAPSGSLLIQHLMQLPALGRGFIQTARQHQHRHGIRKGLPHRCHYIAQTRSGNDISHTRLATGPRVAIGHKTRALLMACQDVANTGLFNAAVHFLIMHTRNSKNNIHAAIFQHM